MAPALPVVFWLLPIVLTVVGVAALVASRFVADATRTPSHWVRTGGTVVDWAARRTTREQTGFCVLRFPVVAWRSPDGREHRFEPRQTVDVGLYPLGRPVEVVLDPADPSTARLASDEPVGGGMRVVLLVGGAAFALLGVVGLVVIGLTEMVFRSAQ